MQTGIESTMLKYFWVKADLFRHNIKDAISDKILSVNDNTYTAVNKDKQRREGIEFEINTVSFYNTSLFAGYAHINAKDMNTKEVLQNSPRRSYDIGLKYINPKYFNAYFKGHYIRWAPDPYLKRAQSFVWDISITKKIYKRDKRLAEAFFLVHNIFNNEQYSDETFKNPERWIEGGLRYKF